MASLSAAGVRFSASSNIQYFELIKSNPMVVTVLDGKNVGWDPSNLQPLLVKYDLHSLFQHLKAGSQYDATRRNVTQD